MAARTIGTYVWLQNLPVERIHQGAECPGIFLIQPPRLCRTSKYNNRASLVSWVVSGYFHDAPQVTRHPALRGRKNHMCVGFDQVVGNTSSDARQGVEQMVGPPCSPDGLQSPTGNKPIKERYSQCTHSLLRNPLTSHTSFHNKRCHYYCTRVLNID